MCGILASCVCPQARDTSHIHGHVIGHTSSHVAGYSNGVGDVRGQKCLTQVEEERHAYANGLATTAPTGPTGEELARQLQAGIDAIRHRGPDGSGVWVSGDSRVGLAHCRLSINDLSSGGDQPLHSDDGQIHAIVNGEVYDYDRLRQECATGHGYRFSGESDSELVVALYKIHGAPGFFEYLRGEFAFILFDEREGRRRVIAGRDRFGIKPLLWTVLGDRVLFAAEAKAFLALGWKPEWNVRAVTDCGWMLDDRTVFKGVRKLMPGHWMELTDERGMEIHKYWDAEYPDKTKPDPRTPEEMIDEVRQQLIESIRLRLKADVPVGVYLSGGIDSSAIAGIVTELSRKENVKIGSQESTRVACFNIRFPPESGYDESDVADRTAQWLGVDIFKRDVDEERIVQDFADAAYHCEHHHWDLNFVAKFALSTLAREHGIKVVLTGEGADEHFCGYPLIPVEFLRDPDLNMPESILAKEHELRERLQKSASAEMNAVFKSQGAMLYEGFPTTGILADANGNTMPNSLLAWHPANSLYKQWVRDQYPPDWDIRETVMAGHSSEVRAKMRDTWHPAHTAIYMWNKSALASMVLACLGDRTEMAHSIEARPPFLDHHFAEYVNSLPPSVKMKYTPPEEKAEDQVTNFWWKAAGSALRCITEKWILREAAKPFITEEMYHRRKLPFLAPVRWPRDGLLHNMFKELLTREEVEKLGFVDYTAIQAALDRAFGDDGETASLRILCGTGVLVTMAKRFGIKTASAEDCGWS